MFRGIRQSIASAVTNVVRVVTTTVKVASAVIFIAGASLGLIAAWPAISDLVDGTCETDLCCMECDTLPVSRVIDGDTFVSDIGRVRLYGMDAPEVGERCAGDATRRLADMAGESVRVEPGPRSHDLYGRPLYYLYTESGDSIDETLVREGLARAWIRDGQHRDLLMELEVEAREKRTGCLWS